MKVLEIMSHQVDISFKAFRVLECTKAGGYDCKIVQSRQGIKLKFKAKNGMKIEANDIFANSNYNSKFCAPIALLIRIFGKF